MPTIKIAFHIEEKGFKHFFDHLITFFAGKPFTHAELVFCDGSCCSASTRDGGVRYKKITFRPEAWAFIELPIKEGDEEKMKAFCDQHVGKKYDYLGAIGFALPIGDDDRKWFCSEIVIDALKVVGFLPDAQSSKIGPSKLYRLLAKLVGKDATSGIQPD